MRGMSSTRRRGPSAGPASSSATDLMTCLIGCLMLVFIGILLVVFITQSLITLSTPTNARPLTPVDSGGAGFFETRAFPRGNTTLEPVYLDVHRDQVVIFPEAITIPQRDVFSAKPRSQTDGLDFGFVPGGSLDVLAARIEQATSGQYVVMLVRPGAADMSKKLAAVLKERGIDIGREFLARRTEVDRDATLRTREYFRAKAWIDSTKTPVRE